jgi:hypothetical protein
MLSAPAILRINDFKIASSNEARRNGPLLRTIQAGSVQPDVRRVIFQTVSYAANGKAEVKVDWSGLNVRLIR